MVSVTLSVPSDLKKAMETFPEINWSAVARQAIERKIQMLRKFREFTRDSEFTEADAQRLGKAVDVKVAERHQG